MKFVFAAIALIVYAVTCAAQIPQINPGGIVNGASFAVGTPVVPGSIASVFGSNFGSTTSGITLRMNGMVAPLLSVSSHQINFQVPWELTGQPQASVTVTLGGVTSVPVTAQLATYSPAIFSVNSSGQGAVLISNSSDIAGFDGTFSNSRPVERSEFISIYCTGLGPVTYQPDTGARAAVVPPSSSPIPATVTFTFPGNDSRSVPAKFSGLAPGFVGLYQVDVQIPEVFPGGKALVSLNVGGAVSNQVSIATAAITVISVRPSSGDASQEEVLPGVVRVNLAANAIALGPANQLLVATPADAGDAANSIVALDPITGGIISSTFVGSDPKKLAASADGSSVYAWLAGDGTDPPRIARMNLSTRQRDLVFAADFVGRTPFYSIWDIAGLPDGGLAVSYASGQVAVFDNGKARPTADLDNDRFATDTYFQLILGNESGTLYGLGISGGDIKGWSVASDGVRSVSEVGSVVGYQARYLNGLVYSSGGNVFDPVRARHVGYFSALGGTTVLPDPESGSIYVAGPGALAVFDINTYELIGQIRLPIFTGHEVPETPYELIKWGPDRLVYHTGSSTLYVVRIPAIPRLAQPIASPQPPPLPSTPGVKVIDIRANDIAYDPVRDLIYATTPESEGVLGEKIVAIDPETGLLVGSVNAGINPRRMAISSDAQRLYYTTGGIGTISVNGIFSHPEGLKTMNLFSGVPSAAYGEGLGIQDFIAIPGQTGSIAVVNGGMGAGTVRIYDNGVQRPKIIGLDFNCTSIQPGGTPDRLYCYNGWTTGFNFRRLLLDSEGVTKFDSSGPDLIGEFHTQILFNDGVVYTTNGRVIDPEHFTLIKSLPLTGPVAVDNGVAYWLEMADLPSRCHVPLPVVINGCYGWYDEPPRFVTLRSFDAATLTPLEDRRINVSLMDTFAVSNMPRLISVGHGRLAFWFGSRQIYIVDPN